MRGGERRSLATLRHHLVGESPSLESELLPLLCLDELGRRLVVSPYPRENLMLSRVVDILQTFPT